MKLMHSESGGLHDWVQPHTGIREGNCKVHSCSRV